MKEMNVCYQNQGDYQLPYITTKEQKELHIGVWANRHRQYLKQHHRIKYYNLLTSERLYPYLADIEEQAEAMFSQLVKENCFQKRCAKKWSTFSKGVPKSGALFPKVCQKVAYFFKKCVKK